jgi:hypothetical protein
MPLRLRQKDNVLECAMLLLSERLMSFVKKRKESCGFGAAQKITAGESPEKKTEETGFASCKALEG